jgi:hypothetical protein
VLKSANYDDRYCHNLDCCVHSMECVPVLVRPPSTAAALMHPLMRCSGFKEYMEKCKPLDMTGWIVPDADDGDSPAPGKRKDTSRRGSMDRGGDRERGWTQQPSAFHEAAPSGVGGMRGAARPRDRGGDREQISSARGRPERYSRDLR